MALCYVPEWRWGLKGERALPGIRACACFVSPLTVTAAVINSMSTRWRQEGQPWKLLILTNLYPPQELGGYGRCMADFAWGLKQRGHHIEVLTSDTRTWVRRHHRGPPGRGSPGAYN